MFFFEKDDLCNLHKLNNGYFVGGIDNKNI